VCIQITGQSFKNQRSIYASDHPKLLPVGLCFLAMNVCKKFFWPLIAIIKPLRLREKDGQRSRQEICGKNLVERPTDCLRREG
jgi:hypothetical protein